MNLPARLRKQVSLASFTSMHVGGAARFFCEPENTEEVAQALEWAKERGEPVFILGRGTNVIVSDGGFEGLVLRLGERFSNMRVEKNQIAVQAGTSLEQVVERTIALGLCGMERLIGIPGGIGGAVYMNAGAFDQSTANCLSYVKAISPEGITERTRDQIEFGYRSSSFQNTGGVVLEAGFRLQPGDPILLKETARDILERRNSKQPVDQHSAGSTFKRPPGNFAGRLIESAGLKGMRIGDAMVSTKHAGFVVNLGKATASEIRALIVRIIETVEKTSGVRLEPEVVFVGRFE